MRTYDQLVAAANATGTYEEYQGDGYSIPWQVALPTNVPLGFTLLSYKWFLDINWPEGARLHDWCYTPYGTLINVTRDEADHALYEYIARDSGLHALVVYTAVRAAGDPYFGTSQTGYHGIQAYRPVSNIVLTGMDPP